MKKTITVVIRYISSFPAILKIAIGLVIGVILGVAVPGVGWIGIFGDLFVGALKAIAPILVFFLVCASIAKSTSGIGTRFRTVVVLYLLTTFCAAITAVTISFLFPVTITLTDVSDSVAPSSLTDIFRTLFQNIVKNPIGSIVDGNYLGILFWAIVFGICLKACAKSVTLDVLSEIADTTTKVVSLIIACAPIGIMGLVFSAVSTSGIAIFEEYGRLVLSLVSAMLISALVVNPFIIWILLKRNPYPLVLTCIKESGLTAFFTRSSAANIPINLKLCEKLGLDRDFYSVSIPLGSTINMNGAAITITTMTLAVCHTLAIDVHPIWAGFLSIIAVLGACGASGVAGGSLLLIPMSCAIFGIDGNSAMQAVAVGFIIGVIQDSFETAHNSSSDAIFTATAEYMDRRNKGIQLNYPGRFSDKDEVSE